MGIFAVNRGGPIDHLVFILLNFIGNLFNQPSFIMVFTTFYGSSFKKVLVNACLWPNKTLQWADEMVQQVLDPKNDDPCSIPKTHMVNRKN